MIKIPPFANKAQQAAIMIKLKEMGITKKPKEIGVTPKYYRARMENPIIFQRKSFRNIPAGKDNHGTRLIVARPHGSKKTKIQSILIRR